MEESNETMETSSDSASSEDHIELSPSGGDHLDNNINSNINGAISSNDSSLFSC